MCVVVLQSIAASGSGFFYLKISVVFLFIKLPCAVVLPFINSFTLQLFTFKSTSSFDVFVVTLIGKHCQVTVNTKQFVIWYTQSSYSDHSLHHILGRTCL